MRTIICVMLLAFSQAAVGQTPQEWIDRAVRANGGADSLAKLKYFTYTSTGKFNAQGTDVNATREAKLALPERAVWTIEFTYQNQKMKTMLALNALSGWQQANNAAAVDLQSNDYETLAEEAYVGWLATIGSLTQKGFTFQPGGEATVGGQPAVGVKVSRAAKPDVTLFFNKSNAMLVKAQFRGREGGLTANKEIVFADHKPFGFIKLPTKTTDFKDGVRMGDWTITDYKFVDKFDPVVFKKP